jgi:hypothetical protein
MHLVGCDRLPSMFALRLVLGLIALCAHQEIGTLAVIEKKRPTTGGYTTINRSDVALIEPTA